MRQRQYTAILGSWLVIGWISSVFLTTAQACAVCVGSEDYGYFWGVLFLMSMPFAVGSLIGGWLWYNYRRPRSRPVTPVSTATDD